ncbi:hypothetical protein QBC43DRAFT_126727 [Cladorrhinum sp. PSN259]|nr:hypothetical protein QBC43DRAFT_126727 [Cladorrhinum sp. PSN259]
MKFSVIQNRKPPTTRKTEFPFGPAGWKRKVMRRSFISYSRSGQKVAISCKESKCTFLCEFIKKTLQDVSHHHIYVSFTSHLHYIGKESKPLTYTGKPMYCSQSKIDKLRQVCRIPPTGIRGTARPSKNPASSNQSSAIGKNKKKIYKCGLDICQDLFHLYPAEVGGGTVISLHPASHGDISKRGRQLCFLLHRLLISRSLIQTLIAWGGIQSNA